MTKKKAGASEMITVQDAAKRKGVSDARVYQWLADGRLTRHEKFGRVVVDVGELDSLTEQKRGPKSRGRKR
jgi:excisionase family DNA binding protein